MSGECAPSALLGNLAQSTHKAGVIAPRTHIVSGTGFSAQLLDEQDTETDVPALGTGVFIQLLSRRPTVWSNLLGPKRCYDTPRDSFVYVPAGCASWWHVRDCGGPMLHMMLDPERLRTLALQEDLAIPAGEPPPSLGWQDRTLADLTRLLLAEMAAPERSRLFMDTLALHLLRQAARRETLPQKSGGLAGWQLKRVTAHMRGNEISEKLYKSGSWESTFLLFGQLSLPPLLPGGAAA